MSDITSLYFIRVAPDGPIKIGLARNVERRRAQLQVANHADLVVIAAYTVPAHLAREIEDLIHARLSYWRLNGEWFEPSAKVIAAAKNPRQIAREGFERRSA